MKSSKNFRIAAVVALLVISAGTGIILNRNSGPASTPRTIPVNVSTPEIEVAKKVARLLVNHPEEWDKDVAMSSLDNDERGISIYVGDFNRLEPHLVSLYIDSIEMPGYDHDSGPSQSQKIIGDAVTRWSLVTRDGKKFRQEVQQKAATEAFLSSEE